MANDIIIMHVLLKIEILLKFFFCLKLTILNNVRNHLQMELYSLLILGMQVSESTVVLSI